MPTGARATPRTPAAAIASADPEGRPALTLVPFLLDALLTRAESRASSAAARGAAAGALFRLAGEPLAKSAIASRPDAVAGLVSLACKDPGVRDPKKPGDLSGSTPSGGDGSDGLERRRRSRGRVVDRPRARRRSERARGRRAGGFHSGVSTPGGGPSARGASAEDGNRRPRNVKARRRSARRLGTTPRRWSARTASHRHLDELAAALVNGHRRRRRGQKGERRDEVNGNVESGRG